LDTKDTLLDSCALAIRGAAIKAARTSDLEAEAFMV
jgi:hypothetical protein